MKVSVIIPVYNVAPFLDNCIQSVLNQTYENLEIILVDDGSTDNSGDIIDKYARLDKRIISYHQNNQGISSARNIGIELSSGKYVMFIDSDDYIAKELIEYLMNLLLEHNADISMCMQKRTNSVDDVWIREPEIVRIEKSIDILNKMYCKEYTFCENYAKYIAVFAKIYKRELIENIRFPIGRYYEDGAVMFIPIHKAKKIVVSNQQMYFYYQRTGSISRRKFDKTKLDRLTAFEDQMKYYKEHNLEKLHYYALNTYLNMFNEFYYQSTQDGNINEFGPYLKKRFRKEWRKYRRLYKFPKERWLELEEFNHPYLIGIYRKIQREGIAGASINIIKKLVRKR